MTDNNMQNNAQAENKANEKPVTKEKRAAVLSKMKRIDLARILVEVSEENDALRAEIAELKAQVKGIKTLEDKVQKVLG